MSIQDMRKYMEDNDLFDAGMGPNQIMAYIKRIREIFEGLSDSEKEKIISKQKIVIHVNAGILNRVIKDLQENSFYGLNPDNVFIVASRTIHGFKFGETIGEFMLDLNSTRLPFGHGEAFEQLFKENERVYGFREEGNKWVSYKEQRSVVSILEEKKVEITSEQRINNLKMWSDEVIDLDSLSFFIANHDADIAVKLVANPGKQKGGTYILYRDPNTGELKLCLIEGVATKGDNIKHIQEVGSQQGWPYNEMATYYRLSKLKAKLINSDESIKKLPRYLKYDTKDAPFYAGAGALVYTDAVTGDNTQFRGVEVIAHQKNSDDTINDFKEMKDFVPGLNAAIMLKKSLASNATAVAPMVMMGQDVTKEWLKAVEKGEASVRFDREIKGVAGQLEIGVRLNSSDQTEFYAKFYSPDGKVQDIEADVDKKYIGDFIAMLNGFRALRPGVSVERKIGRQSDLPPHEARCQFACQESSKPQSLWNNTPLAEFNINGTIWRAYKNASPIDKDGHFVLVPDISDRAQIRSQKAIEKDIFDITAIAHESENVMIAFNSEHAGASVNHIHFQVIHHGETIAIEKAGKETKYRHGDTVISSLVGYPAKAWVFE